MFGKSQEETEILRGRYPAGTRVRLDSMEDSQAPAVGTEGTVRYVDDAGQIHVAWDNGSSLAVLLDVGDRISIVGRKQGTTRKTKG